ncbi:MAG: hypothetical protein ABSF50_21270, partial [Burkholderiaceae bacterium]
AVETSDHDLLVADGSGEGSLCIVNKSGTVAVRGSVPGYGGALLVRTTLPMERIPVLLYGEKEGVYTSLDANLQNPSPAKSVKPMNSQNGRGYFLPDGSLALFGFAQVGAGLLTAPLTAAIGLVSPKGKLDSIFVFEPRYKSGTVADAVPISSNRFLAVRDVAGATPETSGVVLTWITFPP